MAKRHQFVDEDTPVGHGLRTAASAAPSGPVGSSDLGRPAVLGVRAWEAAWDVLGAGPLPRARVQDAMVRAGMAPGYALKVLQAAVQNGHLVAASRDQLGRPTLARPE